MSRLEKGRNETTELYNRKEIYKGAVRKFLKNAPLGSPKLLAVDDLASQFEVKIPYTFDKIKDPALQQVAIELNKFQRLDALTRKIREREITLPGYREATDALQHIVPGVVLEFMIQEVEVDIAKKTDPDRDSEEIANNNAYNELTLLVGERLDELEA